MSKCNDEAFHLARMHGLMELYGDSLGKEANPEDYESVALYFETENNSYLAGKFYLLASAYSEVKSYFSLFNSNSMHNKIVIFLSLFH
jgi:WD repeat-containing protein 19